MSKGNRARRRELGLLPEKAKCIARKRDGTPCGQSPLTGSVVCRMHGGSAPQVLRKAQERIVMAQDDAASLLVKWMNDDAVPWAVRVKAAEGLLNRGGNAPGQRLEVSLDPAPWVGLIEGIVSEVSDDGIRTFGSLRLDGYVDGQVVDLPPAFDNEPGEEDDDLPALPAAPRPTPPTEQRIPSRRRRGNRLAGH